MEGMLAFAGVAAITALTMFIALALESALLRGMLRLMQPAAAERRPVRLQVAHGTRLVSRAFESRG
jgi:hypothetical protein